MNKLCLITNLSSIELAQWVQALGTIAAALLALGAVLLQHYLENHREIRASFNKKDAQLKALLYVSVQVEMQMELLVRRVEKLTLGGFGSRAELGDDYEKDFTACRGMLNEFSIADIPDVSLLEKLGTLRETVIRAPRIAEDIAERYAKSGETKPLLLALFLMRDTIAKNTEIIKSFNLLKPSGH